jgi:hypothetical protein
MTTLQDLVNGAYDPKGGGGDVRIFFEKLKAEDRVFTDGNFKMTAPLQQEALSVADAIMKRAKDINAIPEVQEAKGFDKDAKTLSRDELAALIVGIYLQEDVKNNPRSLVFAGITTDSIRAEINGQETPYLVQAKSLGQVLSKQLFGDTHPDQSSMDTTTSQSLAPLNTEMDRKDAPAPRVRC